MIQVEERFKNNRKLKQPDGLMIMKSQEGDEKNLPRKLNNIFTIEVLFLSPSLLFFSSPFTHKKCKIFRGSETERRNLRCEMFLSARESIDFWQGECS